MPLTSIIIPTHERPDLLGRAVESARRAGSDIEVIIVDDGSEPETSAVCMSLRDVVHVRLHTRRGVGGARAAGIAASSGKYVAFLDDDDARLPGSIDRQVAMLERQPAAGLVYAQVHRATQSLALDGRGPIPRACPSGDVFWRLVASNFIPACSVVARRSAIDAVGGVFADAAPADDWDLWLRLAERFPILALAEPVAIYRKPTLWSRQGSSRIVDGLLSADLRVLQRTAKLPRAMADPRAFRSASHLVKASISFRLLGETLEAATRGDSYAAVSLRHAAAMAGAFFYAMFSVQAWRSLRRRLQW